jgi:hypothetical protein
MPSVLRCLVCLFKAALRRAAERSRDALWQAIGHILERYQPQECRNFFKQAGYAI